MHWNMPLRIYIYMHISRFTNNILYCSFFTLYSDLFNMDKYKEFVSKYVFIYV